MAQTLHDIQLLAMSGALLAGSVLLIVRRIGGRRPVRPWLGYLVSSFSIVLAMLAALYLVQYTGWGLITEPVRLTTFGLIGVAPIVFLFGLLHERLGRASVSELMAFASRTPGPAELQAGVSKALRDPAARVLYWIPEFDSYADIQGRAVDPEPGTGDVGEAGHARRDPRGHARLR